MPKPATIIGKAHPFVKGFSAALTALGVRRGDRVLLAVSGGADSVAMSRAMAALAGQSSWQLELHLAHIHHHLRPEADAEEQFVRDLAQSLATPVHVRHIHPGQSDQNIEAAARTDRYEQLEQIAAEIAADFLTTAHHADDQLETLLMRLIRGATERGLGGIVDRRPLAHHDGQLIRPMLYTDHASAVGFLESLGQAWCEDDSNQDTDRWRSDLRQHVLPALRRLRPDAAHKATEAAARFRSVAKLIDTLAHDAAQCIVTDPAGDSLSRADARSMDPVILQSVIHQQCRRVGVGADRLASRTIEAIYDAATDRTGGSRRFDLAGGTWVEVTAERIIWRR
jgi:tRNA(Ile)-lysidine synthetase-like protein